MPLASWLVYDTSKVVRIADKYARRLYILALSLTIGTDMCVRRLAGLYYLGLLLCVAYVAYSIVYTKGYFEYEAVVGMASITLDDPVRILDTHTERDATNFNLPARYHSIY
jgi:hypothetical protein